jgi:hypothetical protein
MYLMSWPFDYSPCRGKIKEFLLSGIESLVLRRRLRLEAEQQRLGLLEARLEMQSKSLDHAFEIAQKVVGQLHPQADDVLQLSGIPFTSVTIVEMDQAPSGQEKEE